MNSDQGIEEKDFGLDPLDGRGERIAGELVVEPEPRGVDHMEIEIGDVETAMVAQGIETLTAPWEGILGEVDQGAAPPPGP